MSLFSFVRSFVPSSMCVNVRSQREIHLGFSSFRVFFLFFFSRRERESDDTYSLLLTLLLEERFFETDGEKKDFEKRSSSGLSL